MACSCKGGSANKQVTSVKQVVKTPSRTVMASSRPQKKNISKRIFTKRPM
jgi:hypothetical protein